MRASSQKVFVVVLCTSLIVVGLGMAATGGNRFFGIVMVAIGAINLWRRYPQLVRFETMTYETYRRDHPQNTQGGRVTRYNCGGGRLQVRGLMNRTHHREHVCVQCGKALYYSAE